MTSISITNFLHVCGLLSAITAFYLSSLGCNVNGQFIRVTNPTAKPLKSFNNVDNFTSFQNVFRFLYFEDTEPEITGTVIHDLAINDRLVHIFL